MSRRNEMVVLAALVIVLAGVLYWNFRPRSTGDADLPADIAVQPLKVPSPALHLGQLSRIRRLVYTGSHRNIFSATAAPSAPARRVFRGKVRPSVVRPAVPAGPPPLVVPLKFYGMAIDPKTGHKLAFFTNGDNVYIASPGQMLLGHFRLLTIGKDTVRIEDTGTTRTAMLPMTPLRSR